MSDECTPPNYDLGLPETIDMDTSKAKVTIDHGDYNVATIWFQDGTRLIGRFEMHQLISGKLFIHAKNKWIRTAVESEFKKIEESL